MITDDNFIRIGHISGAHALNGRLKVVIISDNPGRFSIDSTVYLKIGGSYESFTISGFSPFKDKICLLQLKGVSDRNRAESLKGLDIFITRDEAEKTREQLDDDSFYYFDLIDCDVYLNNVLFGRVTDIFEAGGGDILIITDMKGKQLMVPFVSSMVDTSQMQNRRIDINPVEGLFDI